MEFLLTKKARRCAARGEEDNASHSARAQACVQAHTYDFAPTQATSQKKLLTKDVLLRRKKCRKQNLKMLFLQH